MANFRGVFDAPLSSNSTKNMPHAQNATESASLITADPADTTHQFVANNSSKRSRHVFLRSSYPYLFVFFMTEMFNFVTNAPLTSLFETVICDRYYDQRPSHLKVRRDCKLEPIQKELAYLKGWKGFFDALPVFFVAYIFGKVSDELGRRFALAISLLSVLTGFFWVLIVCHFPSQFPVKAIWLSAVMFLFGGGPSQVNATILLMAVESVGERFRSQILYVTYTLYLFAELLGPAIASIALSTSVWFAFTLGATLLLLCLTVTYYLKDTQHRANGGLGDSASLSSPSLRDGSTDRPQEEHIVCSTRQVNNGSFPRRSIRLSIPIFVAGQFRSAALSFLVQYVTFRYTWTFSHAALLTSCVAAFNLVFLGPLLPCLPQFLRRRKAYSTQMIDLNILRCSLCLLALGALLIGIAPQSSTLIIGVLIFSAGFGCRASLLALTTSWIEPQHRGRFFGFVQMVENLGLLASDPIVQSIFAVSLGYAKYWSGAAFLFISIVYSMATLCAFCINS